jgi:hypothetical protein
MHTENLIVTIHVGMRVNLVDILVNSIDYRSLFQKPPSRQRLWRQPTQTPILTGLTDM